MTKEKKKALAGDKTLLEKMDKSLELVEGLEERDQLGNILEELESEFKDSEELLSREDKDKKVIETIDQNAPVVKVAKTKKKSPVTSSKTKKETVTSPEKEIMASPEKETVTSLITVKKLASELKISPVKLRKWLRKKAKFEKTEGRWEWSPSDPNLKAIRKEFKL